MAWRVCPIGYGEWNTLPHRKACQEAAEFVNSLLPSENAVLAELYMDWLQCDFPAIHDWLIERGISVAVCRFLYTVYDPSF